MEKKHKLGPMYINPENITYGYSNYKGFEVRKVYISGKLKGEYHIKTSEDVQIEQVLEELKKQIGKGCEIGIVDRTGILNLEYPIYIIVKNSILFDTMDDVWENVEKVLNITKLKEG